MKPYAILDKPQEEIKYLQTIKFFINFYKCTTGEARNLHKHETRARGWNTQHAHKTHKKG